MADRSVTVRLVAITSQYDEAMRRSGQATKDLGDQATLSGTKASKGAKGFDELDVTIKSVDRDSKSAKPNFSALVLSVATLGPALVPVTAAAVAGAGALAGMGVAGVLAFKGIEAEMKAATPLGQAYTGQLGALKTSLATLEHTAAAGLLGPFQKAVADVQAQMPDLNDEIGKFTALLGASGDNLVDGALNGFKALEPLLLVVGKDLEGLTAKFAEWTTDGGLQKFAAYADSVLPTVEHNLSALVEAVGKLVAGIAPLGLTSLSTLGMVAKAINALPVSVLQTLIPLLVSAYIAFKAFQGLNAIAASIQKFTLATKAAAVAEAEATVATVEMSRAVRVLEASAGPVGIALAVLATVYTLFAGKTNDAKQAQDDFKQALIESKGVVDASVLSNTALALQNDGLAGKAAKAGISLSDLTKAVAGNDAQFQQLVQTWTSTGKPSADTVIKLLVMRDAFQSGAKDAASFTAAMNDMTKSTTASAVPTNALSSQTKLLGGVYGATAAQVADYATKNSIALDGTKKSTDAFLKSTIATLEAGTSTGKLAADVAGLHNPLVDATTKVGEFTDALKQESTIAGGDVVRAQDAAQAALTNVAGTLRDGKHAFDQYSEAGRASRSAIDQAAQTGQAYATSVFQSTQSIQQAEQAYADYYNNLVKTAAAQGISKDSLDTYLSSLGELPSQVNAALEGTGNAGQTAADNLASALTSGLNAALGPLETVLDNLVIAMGGRASDVAYSSGLSIGASFASGIASGQYSGAAASQVPSFTGEKPTALPVVLSGATGGVRPSAPPPLSKSASNAAATAAKTAAQKIVDADDLIQAKALAAIDPTNKLALAQEAVTDATTRLNNETKQGTTEYYQDLTKLHQATAALAAERLSEAQAQAQAAKDLASAQKQLADDTKAETDLVAQEATTQAKYYSDLAAAASSYAVQDQQLITARATALEGWASASSKATVQWASSVSWLIGNVKDQVGQFDAWMDALATARANGVSEGVIGALGLDQGPQALSQLQILNKATVSQISDLNAEVAAKNAAAGTEANVEAKNQYGQLGQDLIAAQQQYAAAVIQLQTQFASDMQNLEQQAAQATATMAADAAAVASAQTAVNEAGPAPSQFVHVANPAALAALPPGTAQYIKEPDGSYYHISPGQSQALAPGTAIYTKTYDSGGTLHPGMTVAYNKTGQNEHVFTASQLAELVGGGSEVRVYIGNEEIKSFVVKTVDKANSAKRTAQQVGGAR